MTPESLVILGGPNSGSIIVQTVARAASLRVAGFLNDYIPVGEDVCGHSVLGRFEDWGQLPENCVFIAAVHKATKMGEYSSRLDDLGIPEDRWMSAIDPDAVVAADAQIGAGVYIGPHAVVMPRAKVGPHAALRAGCYVSHGVRIERHGFVGPNAVVSGESWLERGVYVGPGAVIRDGIRIGEFATVALGAVVVRNVPAAATVVGNPARLAPSSSG
jgi:acetyltransferase EpsM